MSGWLRAVLLAVALMVGSLDFFDVCRLVGLQHRFLLPYGV